MNLRIVCVAALAIGVLACANKPKQAGSRESGQSRLMGQTFAGQNQCNPTNHLRPFIIEWDATDALPFPLCVSVKERPGLEISVALGNNVLADHGQTVHDESLGAVPVPRLRVVAPGSHAQSCSHPKGEPIPARFRPALDEAPVSRGFDLAADLAIPLADEEGWFSASELIARDPHDAVPLITELEERLVSCL